MAAAEEDLDGNLVTGYAAAAFLAYFNLYAPFRVPALPSFSFPLFFICQSIQDSIGEEKIKNYRNLISIVLEISYLTNLSFSSYSLTFSLSLYLHLFCISLSLYSRICFLSCQSLSPASHRTRPLKLMTAVSAKDPNVVASHRSSTALGAGLLTTAISFKTTTPGFQFQI